MKISVIIPTYNRKDTLSKSINSLLNQKNVDKKDYEIIIIDDGSTDKTQDKIKKLINKPTISLKYFRRVENKGPASARNLGIKKAKGDLVLFLGDDIIATPDLLSKHVNWHTKKFPGQNVAVLGYITWTPDIKITPFMKWLEKGPQFNYPSIKNRVKVDYKHFYSSNLSLKKDFLLNKGFFDEQFPYAAWEDIELGFRLQKENLKIYYNAQAIAFHYHHASISQAGKRMERVGKSLKILYKIQPDLKKVIPTPELISKRLLLKTFFKTVLARISILKNKRAVIEDYYKTLIDYHSYKGYIADSKQNVRFNN